MAEFRRAATPLINELKAAGFEVESPWDLVNTSEPYPEALPILLKHLQRPYPDAVREGIARALAVKPARFGWDVFKHLYKAEPEGRAKDGLAVAIGVTADDDMIDQVIALARDRRNGPSRLLLLRALEKSKDPRARAALMELGTDPDLQKEIPVILRRLARRRSRRNKG